jgi:hypothetical protein
MNLKVEIDGEQFEIDLFSDGNVIHHADGFVEDDSTWGYEVFKIGDDGERVSINDDERCAEDASEAASYAIHYIVDVLTCEDDHNRDYGDVEDYCNCEGSCGIHSDNICRNCNKCPSCCTCAAGAIT